MALRGVRHGSKRCPSWLCQLSVRVESCLQQQEHVSPSHDGLLAVRHGSASRLSWLCKEFGIAVGAVFQGKQYFFDTQKDKYTKYLWV